MSIKNDNTLYYDFEGSESTVVDRSGNNNDATLSDINQRTEDGILGKAVEFGGDEQIVTGVSLFTGTTPTFTLSFWFNDNLSAGSQFGRLINFSDTIGNGISISRADATNNNKYVFRVFKSGFRYQEESNIGVFPTGTWHFLLVEFNGSTNTLTVYKNNTTITSTSNNASANNSNVTSFAIGGRGDSGGYVASKFDEVGYWTRLLTAQEREDLYNDGEGFNPYASVGPTAPTVTTQAVSDIEKTTATGNGNVTADGGETITERGVVWATTTGPTTADSKATSAGTTGAFTASMTGLTTDTLYYVRAYAINSEGTSYGDEVTFTTLALDNPTVTTQAATSVSAGGATLNGNVTSLGDFSPVDARFQYRETSSGTWLETSLATDVTTGAYTFGLTGLTPETEYEFRAKVEYDTDQEAFGDTLTFTTLEGDTAPALTTGAATVVRATLATANGEVTADGGQPVTERGFVWATTTAPDVTDNKVEVVGTTGEYSVKLTGLSAETLIYLKTYAINSVGTSYGNEVSFTTLALSAVKNPMYRNDGGVLRRIN